MSENIIQNDIRNFSSTDTHTHTHILSVFHVHFMWTSCALHMHRQRDTWNEAFCSKQLLRSEKKKPFSAKWANSIRNASKWHASPDEYIEYTHLPVHIFGSYSWYLQMLFYSPNAILQYSLWNAKKRNEIPVFAACSLFGVMHQPAQMKSTHFLSTSQFFLLLWFGKHAQCIMCQTLLSRIYLRYGSIPRQIHN